MARTSRASSDRSLTGPLLRLLAGHRRRPVGAEMASGPGRQVTSEGTAASKHAGQTRPRSHPETVDRRRVPTVDGVVQDRRAVRSRATTPKLQEGHAGTPLSMSATTVGASIGPILGGRNAAAGARMSAAEGAEAIRGARELRESSSAHGLIDLVNTCDDHESCGARRAGTTVSSVWCSAAAVVVTISTATTAAIEGIRRLLEVIHG
jgi:hypothetical protein